MIITRIFSCSGFLGGIQNLEFGCIFWSAVENSVQYFRDMRLSHKTNLKKSCIYTFFKSDNFTFNFGFKNQIYIQFLQSNLFSVALGSILNEGFALGRHGPPLGSILNEGFALGRHSPPLGSILSEGFALALGRAKRALEKPLFGQKNQISSFWSNFRPFGQISVLVPEISVHMPENPKKRFRPKIFPKKKFWLFKTYFSQIKSVIAYCWSFS